MKQRECACKGCTFVIETHDDAWVDLCRECCAFGCSMENEYPCRVPTKCLSLSRPWPWILLYLGKRIENRRRDDGRMPHIARHRGPLYLHAAKSFDDSALGWCRETFGMPHWQIEASLVQPEIPAGVIFGRCTVFGHVEPTGIPWNDRLPGSLDKRFETLDFRWHMRGQFGMALESVSRTRIVACKGSLGLWTVPAEVLHKLKEAA